MKELVASTVGSVEIQQLKQKHELKVVWLTPRPATSLAQKQAVPRMAASLGRPCPKCPGASRPQPVPARSGASFAISLSSSHV